MNLGEERHVGALRHPLVSAEDDSNIAALFAEQYEPMVRLAYLLTGNRAVAEDLVQDSFVRVHRRWASVQQPLPYLRTAVVNACRGHHRRAGREAAHFADMATDQIVPETFVILDALGDLPYRQRAALVLKYWQDWHEAEIAIALGCRPATVRSLVHRGLARLRKAMEE